MRQGPKIRGLVRGLGAVVYPVGGFAGRALKQLAQRRGERAGPRSSGLRRRLAETNRRLEAARNRLNETNEHLDRESRSRRQSGGCAGSDSDDDHSPPPLSPGAREPLPVAENEALFGPAVYNYDGLAVWAKDVSFLQKPAFSRAYERGQASGHAFRRPGYTLHYGWNTHVACWAAWHAAGLPGSLVECGVNTGNLSLAVCDYVDLNSTGKDFFLFDTFEGIPEDQMAEEEREERMAFNQVFYDECYDTARRNFAPFAKAHLVRGKVPETLHTVEIDEVCYLSIDMNIAEPEIAALEFFWPRLVSGAPVLLDDYGWANCRLQRQEMDKFASRKNVEVLALPTGQGLLVKR